MEVRAIILVEALILVVRAVLAIYGLFFRLLALPPRAGGHERQGHVGGLPTQPHFKSHNSHSIINCSRPPKIPCKACGNAHWYWQGGAHGCKG